MICLSKYHKQQKKQKKQKHRLNRQDNNREINKQFNQIYDHIEESQQSMTERQVNEQENRHLQKYIDEQIEQESQQMEGQMQKQRMKGVGYKQEQKQKQNNGIYSDIFLLQKVDENGQVDLVRLKEFILNENGIFYRKQNESDLEDSIRYEELVSNQEMKQLEQFQQSGNNKFECCDQISRLKFIEIKLNYLELENDEIYQNQEHNTFYCMEIKDRSKNVEWRICCHNELLEQKQQRIREFRNQIIKRILQKVESIKDIRLDQEVIVQDNYDKNGLKQNDIDSQNDYDSNIMKEWSYAEQNEWTGNCQNDKIQQSPINLKKYGDNESSSLLQIQFDYKLITMTKIRNQQEYYLDGDLGQIVFTNLIENKEMKQKYCGFRIELKFGGEHQIDKNSLQLEVLVYHVLKIGGQQCMSGSKVMTQKQEEQQLNDMTDLIVSFLVTTDSSQLQDRILEDDIETNPQTIESGQFMNELGFTDSSDNIGMVYSRSRLMKASNLMDIVIGGLDGTMFKKSFLYYSGSLSKPSCQQTKRIIMTQKIYIDKQTYLNIHQKYTIDGMMNSRIIQNRNIETMVQFHRDTSQQCSGRMLQIEIKKKIQNLRIQNDRYNEYNEEINRLQKYLKKVEKLDKSMIEQKNEQPVSQKTIRQMVNEKQAVVYRAQTEICQIMLVKKTRADSIFSKQNMEINNSNADLQITKIDVSNRRDLNNKLNQLKQLGYCEDQIQALRSRLPKESDTDIYEIQDMRPKQYNNHRNLKQSINQNMDQKESQLDRIQNNIIKSDLYSNNEQSPYDEQNTQMEGIKIKRDRFHSKSQMDIQKLRFKKQ